MEKLEDFKDKIKNFFKGKENMRKVQKLERYIYEKFYKGDEFWELVWKQHVLKVKEIALKLAEEENAKKEILWIASILHDVSQRDFGIKDHAKKSSEIARKILKEFGFEGNIIQRVCEIIENHHNCEKTLNKEDILLKVSDLVANLDPILLTIKAYHAKNELNLKNFTELYAFAHERIIFHSDSLEKLTRNLKESSKKIIRDHLFFWKLLKYLKPLLQLQ